MEMYAPGAIEQVSEESIRRLDDGGLPVLAERRLAALFGSSAERFTSQLSVSEFALTRSIGLRSVSQVLGSCVYHARLALDRAAPAPSAERGKAYLMQDVAEPWNAARERALRRMSAEAKSCGADAVVGVGIRPTQEHLDGGYDASVEFVATGTAVVGTPARTATTGRPGPALTNLSAQDYWKLVQQGFAAVGVVAYTAVVGCVPSVETHRAESAGLLSATGRQGWEVAEFSEGLRLVHRTAFAQLGAQAERMGAEGIVGVTIERDQHTAELRNSSYQNLILVVHAIGTAIAPGHTPPPSTPPPGSPLTITPVQHLDKKGGIDS
jgi:uncharacterized protein YbjQ (UPF0145 family)